MSDVWGIFFVRMGDYQVFISFNYGFVEIVEGDLCMLLFSVCVFFVYLLFEGLLIGDEFVDFVKIEDLFDVVIIVKGGVQVGCIIVDGNWDFLFYVLFDEEVVVEIVDLLVDQMVYVFQYVYQDDFDKMIYWQMFYLIDDDWQIMCDMCMLDVLWQ